MDGTLCEPRCQVSDSVASALFTLSKHGNVGILTGSKLEYVLEQCNVLMDGVKNFENMFYLMPCNGTQFYYVDKNKNIIELQSRDMRKQVSDEAYEKLMMHILSKQWLLSFDNEHNIPLTGTFTQYRQSMLNWSVIGRDANKEQRKIFETIDNQHSIRKNLVNDLKILLNNDGILDLFEMSIGGSTSIDIYPKGWSKKFALNFLEKKDTYFFGDQCGEGGNDEAIYLELLCFGSGWHVANSGETIEKVNQLVEIFEY